MKNSCAHKSPNTKNRDNNCGMIDSETNIHQRTNDEHVIYGLENQGWKSSFIASNEIRCHHTLINRLNVSVYKLTSRTACLSGLLTVGVQVILLVLVGYWYMIYELIYEILTSDINCNFTYIFRYQNSSLICNFPECVWFQLVTFVLSVDAHDRWCMHWRPVGDLLLLFVLWSGCCLFDTFPISILNFIVHCFSWGIPCRRVGPRFCSSCNSFGVFYLLKLFVSYVTCIMYVYTILAAGSHNNDNQLCLFVLTTHVKVTQW